MRGGEEGVGAPVFAGRDRGALGVTFLFRPDWPSAGRGLEAALVDWIGMWVGVGTDPSTRDPIDPTTCGCADPDILSGPPLALPTLGHRRPAPAPTHAPPPPGIGSAARTRPRVRVRSLFGVCFRPWVISQQAMDECAGWARWLFWDGRGTDEEVGAREESFGWGR